MTKGDVRAQLRGLNLLGPSLNHPLTAIGDEALSLGHDSPPQLSAKGSHPHRR